MKKKLVLDCDGFLTDAEREGVPFRAAYIKNFGLRTNTRPDDIMAWVKEYEAVVRANPDEYGYKDPKGRIVAPANADPYLRIVPVANMILDRVGLYPDPDTRKELLTSLFRESYRLTKTVFRPGVKRVIEALEGTNTDVVTNSHTDDVARKMRRLGAIWLSERVHGLARKFDLVDEWDLVPEMLYIPGLTRPVYLRRKFYFERLDVLRQEAEVEWDEVLVGGDILELDGITVLELGGEFALLPNDNTPQYEIDYVASHPRGHVLTSISGILPLVGIA